MENHLSICECEHFRRNARPYLISRQRGESWSSKSRSDPWCIAGSLA